jgi:hypothetical protein
MYKNPRADLSGDRHLPIPARQGLKVVRNAYIERRGITDFNNRAA